LLQITLNFNYDVTKAGMIAMATLTCQMANNLFA